MSAAVLLLLAVSISLSKSSRDVGTLQVGGSGFAEGSGSIENRDDRALFDPSQVCIQPDSDACSTWLWRKNSSTCECGDSLSEIVLCKNDTETIAIIQCCCMYNDVTLGYSYVGACLYGCFRAEDRNPNFTKLYNTYSTNDSLDSVCSRWNRSGPLCGKCKENKGVAVYSFSLKCRECHFHWTNIVRYVAIAYGPLTVFFVIIVLFTVSIHSAPLQGYIFVAQMISTSYIMRILQIMNEDSDPPKLQRYPVSFAATVYGIWNLDFFRFVNSHFCLHPKLSTLAVISLDYLIAAYPFVIILATYTLVLLHGRGCKVLVFLWRPFNCVFARFRENLDIRTSLVDAFGTFFSLSYVKFLSTTVDLLAPTTTRGVDGHHLPTRVYYEGHLTYMKGVHVYYAVMGIAFFILFSIIPLVLSLLYPRRFFQRRLPPSVKRILHPFMDTLLGLYRDGTNGSSDCRYFTAIYPIARIATFTVLMMVRNSFCFLLITGVMSVTAILVAVIQPYKSKAYNRVDTILLVNVALIFASLTAFFFADSVSSQQLVVSRVLMTLFISLPFLYVCGLTLYKIWTSCKLRRKLVRMSKAAVHCCGRVYLHLVEKTRGRCEMEAFPSLSERTALTSPGHRDLND